MVGDGEFIVNADATAKNKALLNAINSGKAPGIRANVPSVSNVISNINSPTSDARQTTNHYTVQSNSRRRTPTRSASPLASIAAEASVHIQRMGSRMADRDPTD